MGLRYWRCFTWMESNSQSLPVVVTSKNVILFQLISSYCITLRYLNCVIASGMSDGQTFFFCLGKLFYIRLNWRINILVCLLPFCPTVPSWYTGHCWDKTTAAPASQPSEAGTDCSGRNLQIKQEINEKSSNSRRTQKTSRRLRETSPRSSLRSSSSGTVVILLPLLWFGSEISVCGQKGEPRFDSASFSSSTSPSFFVFLPTVITFSTDSWCSSSSSQSVLLLMSGESGGLSAKYRGSA